MDFQLLYIRDICLPCISLKKALLVLLSMVGIGISHRDAQADTHDQPFPITEHSTASSSCLIPSAGAPSCEVDSNIGSSPISTDLPYHVGNPIDVISGNKYQREIDYRSFDTGLALVRHYNSSLADYQTGFGRGWRHTYQIFLTKSGNADLNIVQSDGRLVEFKHVADSDSPKVYQAQSLSDGVLAVSDKQAVWYLPDNRQITFNGSYLTAIDFNDHRGRLTLNYEKRRVHTVTDSRGGVLTFNYTDKQSSLPSYGEDGIMQPAGSIKSVNLPNGDLIEYLYGDQNNLASAAYPDGDSVRYGYGNSNWPNHLTFRRASLEGRENTWEYDVNGLAIEWSEGAGGNSARIQRGQSERSNQQRAKVVYADGRLEHFRWVPLDTTVDTSNQSIQLTCDNCSGSNKVGTSRTSDASASTATGFDRTTQQIWQTLSRSKNTERKPGSDVFDSAIQEGDDNIAITVTANRLGEVSNLAIGNTSLTDLAPRMLRGELPSCAAVSPNQTIKSITQRRLNAMNTNDGACSIDPLVLLNLVESLNTHSKGTTQRHSKSLNLDSGSRRGRVIDFLSGHNRYCSLPPGKTCADLHHDLEMANLSRCSYATNDCQTYYDLADLNSLGLDPNMFHDDGFDAVLYRNPLTNHYVLSFRGTDGLGDDWDTNFAQARGQYARQYELAQRLALDLEAALLLRGNTFSFTGHSLGGGLAILAAIATRTQADVFNSSAVQPATAQRYGYLNEYNQSNNFVNHLHTDSDPLTLVQTIADDLDYNPTTYDYHNHRIDHDEIQSVHGNNTEIPNPDLGWVNEVHAQNRDTLSGFRPVINHSINAVIYTLENIILRNCVTTP